MKRNFLIYGAKYVLRRDGEEIGVATWTDDPNIGDAFIQVLPNGQRLVFQADEWELLSPNDPRI